MRVLGRIRARDESIRDVEVEARDHGTAKIELKGQVGDDEQLLFIRCVPDEQGRHESAGHGR
jgi:hypothetical protein